MPTLFDEWTPLPHGPLVELSDNLRIVTGSLPKSSLPRTCTFVRLPEQRFLVHSAIALDEETWSRVLEWGVPAVMVVPNAWHRLDAPAFKKRYPDLLTACPERARKAVQRAVPVDRSLESLDGESSLGGAVSFRVPPGTRGGECVMRVRSADGYTLVFNDLIFNIPSLPGPQGRVMRWLGSTGGPRVTAMGRLFGVSSRKDFARWLEEQADDPELRRLVVAHGEPVLDGAGDVLRVVAHRLFPRPLV